MLNNKQYEVQQVIECPYDADMLEKVNNLLLYKKIIRASDNALVLDNGTILEIEPNQGTCGGCTSGDYEITELNVCDNAITNVELVCEEIDDVTQEYDHSYKIFVYAEDKKIKVLQVDGTDGNGHYGTGYTIFVKKIIETKNVIGNCEDKMFEKTLHDFQMRLSLTVGYGKYSVGMDFSEDNRIVVDKEGYIWIGDECNSKHVRTTVNIENVNFAFNGCGGKEGVYLMCGDGTGLHFSEDDIYFIIDGEYSGWGPAFYHFKEFPDGDSRAASRRVNEAMEQWRKRNEDGHN